MRKRPWKSRDEGDSQPGTVNEPASEHAGSRADQVGWDDPTLASDRPADESALPEDIQQTLRLLKQAFPQGSTGDPTGDPTGDASPLFVSELTGNPVTVGRFLVQRKLGTGTFGTVYLAEDKLLQRQVALKLPKPAVLLCENLCERFLREARAASSLHHPHIVPVLDANAVAGDYFIASEYCEGPTLQQWLREQESPSDPRITATIVSQLASAVQHAHEQEILHRDIKPANVMLQPLGHAGDEGFAFTVKLTDFGLAKLEDRADGESTGTGILLGTLPYMAPEQVRDAKQAGKAADIYALGVLLYELLTGQLPFSASDSVRLLVDIADSPPKPPRKMNPRIPADLQAICLNCLEKNPDNRYASAQDLAADLRHFLQGEPVQARRLGTAAHVQRWAKRHPALAMSAFSIFLLIGFAAGVLFDRDQRLSQMNRTLSHALEESRTSAARATASDLRTHQLAYASDMELAGVAYKNGEVQQLVKLLERNIPVEGEPDARGFEWNLLWKTTEFDHAVLADHTGDVYAVACSPHGQWLASAGEDDRLRLYNLASLTMRRTLPAEQGSIRGLAFSPDGLTLASAGEDGSICIWDGSRDFEQPLRIDAHPGGVTSVLFVPGQERLISAGEDPVIRIWDATTGELLDTLEGHRARVDSLALSVDGIRLGSASRDRTVRIWNLPERRAIEERVVNGRYRSTCIDFDPQGTWIAAGSLTRGAMVWRADQDSGGSWSPHFDTVESVSCSPDGKWGADADRGGVVRLWPIAPGSEAPPWRGAEVTPRAWQAHRERIWSICFTPDSGRLVTASRDGTVRVWSLEEMFAAPYRRIDQVASYFAIMDEKSVAAVDVAEDALRYWNLPPGAEEARRSEPPTISSEVPRLAACREHDLLAVAGPGEFIQLLEADTFREVTRSAPIAQDGFDALALHPAGSLLAVLTNDQFLMFEIPSFERIKAFPSRPYNSLAFSPDGRWLALGARPADTIELWDVKTRRCIRTLPKNNGSVSALCFSPDSQTLASGDGARMIKLWEMKSGRLQFALSGHHSSIADLAYHPDGTRLTSIAQDGELKVWHLATRRAVLSLAAPQAASDPFHQVDVTPDGRFLLVRHARESVLKVYDLAGAAVIVGR